MKRNLQNDMFSDLQYRTQAKAAKKRANRAAVAPSFAPAPSRADMRLATRARIMDTGYVDIAPTAYQSDTTGSVTLLNTVPPGATQNSRVGKKILLKGLNIRGMVYNKGTAFATDNSLIIVYDKRPTGSDPAVTAFLKTATSQSQNNDDNASRFRVLRRLDFALVGNSTNMTGDAAKSVDFYVDLRKAPTVYKSASTGQVADIAEGALWMVIIGATAPGTAAATFEISTRVRYYDL